MKSAEKIANYMAEKSIKIMEKHLLIDPDIRVDLEKDLQLELYDYLKSGYNNSSLIITAGYFMNWLQRGWRPLLMLTFIGILFNNFILAPYLCDFFPKIFHRRQLPEQLYTLMEIGVGSYIVLRTSEKTGCTIIDTMKNMILPKK